MFHPRMTAMTEGFSVVGSLKYRAWGGVVADVWEVDGAAGAWGRYQSPNPRLFVVLNGPGADAISIHAEVRDVARPSARISYIPAGLPTQSYLPVDTRLRHLDLHFDAAAMVGRFAGEIDETLLSEPRLMFDDERLLTLAHLLADECMGPGLHDLYGEGIALALFTQLFEVRRAAMRPGQLSPRRLRQAMDFIEANCLRNIRLQEVADVVGLSPSYFSSAFKASTGMAPHQWQTQARVERVKPMLLQPGATLTDVSAAGGFADQAHMTRIFKRYAGTTPAAWVRNRGAAG